MRRTLVVGAAPLPGHEAFYRGLLGRAEHVVAADAAGEWCVALGRVPDLVVGDFDGSKAGAAERLRALGSIVEAHPCDKAETDLELAVARALATWDDAVVLTASFTLRVDHSLAAFGALARAGDGASAIEPGWTAHVARPAQPVTLDLPPGAVVSVIALGGEARVSLEGARWPLREATMQPLSGLGVSNTALGGPFVVTVKKGIVAVIVQDRGSGGLY